MLKPKIRIGHVGTLHDHSLGKLNCVGKYPDIFEVIGIVEENPERRRLLETEYPYSRYSFMSEEELLNRGCDAVLVEGDEYDLPYVAKRFLEKGIAVHMDKPAGGDIKVLEAALKTAKKRSLPVQVAYMYRYNPAVKKCMQMIKDGQLGEIMNVTAVMNTGHPLEKQQWLHRFQGGIMFFLGCHMVDLIYGIQGLPNKVTPFLHESNIRGIPAVNQATAVLEYDAGISVAQANSCEINGYGRRQLVVCGTKGTLEIRPLERKPQVPFTDIQNAEPFGDRHTEFGFPEIADSCRYDDMMMDFAQMVRGEIENPYAYEYELQVQKLILACCGLGNL